MRRMEPNPSQISSDPDDPDQTPTESVQIKSRLGGEPGRSRPIPDRDRLEIFFLHHSSYRCYQDGGRREESGGRGRRGKEKEEEEE